ncbi:MAG: polyisoprenoid-binding protein [Alphaproteobacteria bacterium]|nr:polyisoprenoid-binding protein [Alphaproteobacteria bacterium]
MRFILALALIAFSTPALAAPNNYILEKPHTQIVFSIGHMGLSHSYGKFTDFDGKIQFDPTQPEKGTVNVTIKTASLDLNDATWNEHTAADKLLDAANFPEMTFESTSIKVTGEKTADITGNLTLHGVTKPVVLATIYNQSIKHPMAPKMMAGFSATTTIKRSDFGISYGIPMIDDEVKIIIEVEAECTDCVVENE